MHDWQSIPNASDYTPWHKNKGLLKLNFFHSILFVGLVLNGFDGTIISRILALPQWNEDVGLTEYDGVRLGFLNAVGYFAGFAVGPLIAWIDDTYGRRWGIRFYGWTMIIGTIFGCVAGLPNVNGYALFVVGRAIIGLGLSSFLMTSLTVVQEISHPRTRRTMAASWDSYWILGSVIASWLVFGTGYLQNSWSWRIPYIVQVPMALYVLIGVQFVPETPRFLIAHGRDAEALKFFVDYHGNGDPKDPLVLFEFEEMKQTIQLEREAGSEKWRNIVKNKGSLHRLGLAALMTFCTSLSGSSIMYYYYTTVFDLVGITDPTVQTAIGAGLSVYTYFIQIAAVFVGKRVGSKTILLWVWPLLGATLVALCVSVQRYTVTGKESAAIATTVMVWFYFGFFNFTNPVLYAYPAEVQTYSLRTKGLLVWNQLNQMAGAYTTWVDAIALERIGAYYFLVYLPLVIIQWILIKLYMVETRTYTLEEIARAFGDSVPEIDRQIAELHRVDDRPRKSFEDIETK